ncbi:methionine aminotransferase [Vibrio quintilis]|uniref:Methionine aminotransferase n=1 Tax=Vibrio quintilis TaxID=1117707 RepID=A0A1M7YZJ0_9VIBR|nr:methionine aminotransferase [Vibrio quintilis]SHO58078.1 Methionine aminotransferase [Vibrio quintilis]
MIQTPLSCSSKLSDVGTTIFTRIGELAAQYQAINLSQGAPGFPVDPALIQRVTQAMTAGQNQYAPMAGLPVLKEKIAEKMQALYGRTYHPDEEITITASASQAIYASISALVHSQDEVIYFEPAFDSYAPVVRLQGAKPVAIQLSLPEFKINWDEVKAAMTPRTRMIILNTPHNPTGTILSSDDLHQLAAIIRDTGIIVLSDEVYEHMVFDGELHQGMARHPELAARSVIIASFGKTFHVTGWRVGYCLAPQTLMKEIVKVHQFMMFSADTPMQYAFAVYMDDPQRYLSLAGFYQKKRDLLIQELSDGPFQLYPSQGAFFMLAGFGHQSDIPDTDMVQRLIREAGVATIPLSAFYAGGTDQRLLRLSFTKDDETIIAGARALKAFRF